MAPGFAPANAPAFNYPGIALQTITQGLAQGVELTATETNLAVEEYYNFLVVEKAFKEYDAYIGNPPLAFQWVGLADMPALDEEKIRKEINNLFKS